MTEKFICFDIGGTKIFKGVVEVDFGRRKFEFLDSDKAESPIDSEEIKKLLSDYCKKSQEKFNTNKVAISSARPIDYDNLRVVKSKNFYGVEDFDFKFLKKSGYQVVLENDGKAFSLGQYYFGDNEDKQGLLTLTLGTGIGGGFINAEGRVLRGRDCSAVEFGYIRMQIDNGWENWWMISAGQGIEKRYSDKTGQQKKTKEIFELAEENSEARAVIKTAQEYLGYGMANLIDTFDPEKIVFGGSIAAQKAYLEGAMEISRINVFDKKGFPEWSISKLKEEMNVLGVCSLYYV